MGKITHPAGSHFLSPILGIFCPNQSIAGFQYPLPDLIHQKLLDFLRKFMLTGGMPEAVAKYAETRQLMDAQRILDDLYIALKADFTKYKNTVPPARLVEVFESVARQTGGKFVFNKASTTANHGQIREALDLLIMASLVLRKIFQRTKTSRRCRCTRYQILWSDFSCTCRR